MAKKKEETEETEKIEEVEKPKTNYAIRVTNGKSTTNCKEQEIPKGYRRVEK